jgi:hypothetical protein
MSAFEALAAAKAAGVKLTLDGDGIILETKAPPLPADVVELLRSFKPGLLRILEWREAAKATFLSKPPPDAREDRWALALQGLHRFVWQGWSDQAALLGWSKEELFRVPPLWSRIDLAGAPLLIADQRVIAVTEHSIAAKTPSGSTLKFRRIGREHLA